MEKFEPEKYYISQQSLFMERYFIANKTKESLLLTMMGWACMCVCVWGGGGGGGDKHIVINTFSFQSRQQLLIQNSFRIYFVSKFPCFCAPNTVFVFLCSTVARNYDKNGAGYETF